MFQAIDEMTQRFDIRYIDGWKPSFISKSDQLLMTLMKLTMNTPLLDLAERFNTSASSVNNIVSSYICALHEILYEGLVESYIPSLQKCKGSMPTSFGDFSSCRIVLDATEIGQDVPGNDMRLQASTYSGYKNSHTVKSVTGVAPNGALVFISKLYPGSTSDVAIVEHCKLMDQLVPGDMVLADKGFTIHKLLPQGVHLNIPPFLTSKAQYTPSEVQLCRKIAKSRIHVERANERIKNYEILRHIPHQFRFISTKIFQLCCVLVNFQDPLLQEIAQNFVPNEN
jgi:hypothetical protein